MSYPAKNTSDGEQSSSPSSLLLRLALCLATAAASAMLWIAWCEFPFYAWNEVRLVPAFAIRDGINPYPPFGGGPLFTWIYGPVGALINLPATFAVTAKAAMQSACVINLLTLFAPLALIFFTATEMRGPALRRWLALIVAVLFIPRPNFVLQVADHSAIAFGILSLWCLARVATPAGGRLALAAFFCALAVWSKQITLFILPAQLVFLWMMSGRRTTLLYLAWVALFGFLALAFFSIAFGFSNLWFNLVVIPGRLPWAEFGERLAMRPWSLVAQIAAPTIGLCLLWRLGAWPSRETESGRFFQLSVLAAIAMLPVGLAGFFKIGGDTNLLHSWDYLLPALLLAWLARDWNTPATAVRVLFVIVGALALHARDFATLPRQPFTRHFAAAESIMAAAPHALWFPQNPIITFYADGRIWHSEDGILTRYAAGYGIREPEFRSHLPPNLQGAVYPDIVEFPFAMPLLPELSRVRKVPYWKLHLYPEKPATPSSPQSRVP